MRLSVSRALSADDRGLRLSIRSSDLKPCQWCGKTIEPKKDEPISAYEKHIYCGQTCSGAAYASGARTRMAYVLKDRAGIPEKICTNCEKPFPIGDLKPAMYMKWRHCDACVPVVKARAARASAAAMIRDVGARVCEICQGEFTRRDGETVGNFEVRRTCDTRACRAEIRARSKMGKPGKARVEFER